MQIVALAEGGSGSLRVRLRAPDGWDELSVSGNDPSTTLALVQRLASDPAGRALDVAALTVTQADRLIAAIYGMLYGERAECRVRCSSCGESYEFTLSVPELVAAQDAAGPGPCEADGAWPLPDGRRVRAPRVGDLAAAEGPAALLARLVVAGDPAAAPERVTDFLDRAAPTLAVDLEAPCPHCSHGQAVRFDLVRYLAQRLAGERPFLIRETHLIASRYGWSHAEIMGLTRADRHAYAGLIEAERAGAQRRRAG